MEKTYPLYLMLSRTPTGMGKAIRFFTRYGYNHVSLSLDPEFHQWVSFARYVQGVPLAGGFVTESPERYFCAEGPIPVKIFRLDISEQRYQKLQTLFARAGSASSGLIYNTLGALITPIGLHFTVPGAYTCLEFADAVLEESHRSIKSLDICHRSHLIYEGDLRDLVNDSGNRCGSYFVRRGPWGGTVDTTRHFARLCYRLIFPRSTDLVTFTLQ